MTANRVSKFGHQINLHQTVLVCGVSVLTLPSPDFENHEKLQYTRVNSKTRGNDLIMFRANYWPKSRIFSMQWTGLKRTHREALLIFLRENIGKRMTLNDHEGRSYPVVILTPESELSENERNQHTVNLDFETDGNVSFIVNIQETPSGLINGSNVDYILTYPPSQPDSLLVYLNGLLQRKGALFDYVLSGNVITFAVAPTPGDTIVAYYLH